MALAVASTAPPLEVELLFRKLMGTVWAKGGGGSEKMEIKLL